jgi:hypothetical protein
MSTTFGKVTKLYELRHVGFDQLTKEQDTVIVKYRDMTKAKREFDKAVSEVAKSKGTQSEDYKQAIAALDAQKIKTAEVRTESERLRNEKIAIQNVRQAEINQQKLAQNANSAEAGSIAVLRKEKAELNRAIISKTPGNPVEFRGQTLSYDQAISKLKQLTEADAAYRRQFAKDGTLVGEYTSGIVKAFKQMGLGDLIGGQITQAKAKLTQLNG